MKTDRRRESCFKACVGATPAHIPHRSHFGSRYHIWLLHFASLFLPNAFFLKTDRRRESCFKTCVEATYEHILRRNHFGSRYHMWLLHSESLFLANVYNAQTHQRRGGRFFGANGTKLCEMPERRPELPPMRYQKMTIYVNG